MYEIEEDIFVSTPALRSGLDSAYLVCDWVFESKIHLLLYWLFQGSPLFSS